MAGVISSSWHPTRRQLPVLSATLGIGPFGDIYVLLNLEIAPLNRPDQWNNFYLILASVSYLARQMDSAV